MRFEPLGGQVLEQAELRFRQGPHPLDHRRVDRREAVDRLAVPLEPVVGILLDELTVALRGEPAQPGREGPGRGPGWGEGWDGGRPPAGVIVGDRGVGEALRRDRRGREHRAEGPSDRAADGFDGGAGHDRGAGSGQGGPATHGGSALAGDSGGLAGGHQVIPQHGEGFGHRRGGGVAGRADARDGGRRGMPDGGEERGQESEEASEHGEVSQAARKGKASAANTPSARGMKVTKRDASLFYRGGR
ncbi:hypothetical protein JCM2811A_16830 [Methylorubrum rhodinum]